ncbi:MAG: hypothetical protein WA364_27210, partial [Candidatus Nitrosopolaris sp.]
LRNLDLSIISPLLKIIQVSNPTSTRIHSPLLGCLAFWAVVPDTVKLLVQYSPDASDMAISISQVELRLLNS